MEIKIKTVDFAKCGHINVFLEDGRQITIHKRDLYEKMELSPEVEEAILQIQIREWIVKQTDAPVYLVEYEEQAAAERNKITSQIKS